MSDSKISVLIITYKDLDDSNKAGSTRRPLEMIESFRAIGCSVKVLSGLQNRIPERTKRVKEIVDFLEGGAVVDFCYIEPPAGPLLCPADVSLIRRLSSRNIPTALFYRDAYWVVPGLFGTGNRLKDFVIRLLSKRDLRLFREKCRVLYYPSDGLKQLVDAEATRMGGRKSCREALLPPGCIVPEEESHKELTGRGIPTAIYVGAATDRYGAPTILASAKALNREEARCNLVFVCPKNQWDTMGEEYLSLCGEQWFTLVHTSDAAELRALYGRADFALMAYARNLYNDIAAPIKLYEYVSYLKPVLSTDCTYSAEFIRENNVGIVVPDSVDGYIAGLEEMCERFDDTSFREALLRTRRKNTWKKRAEKVCCDLGFVPDWSSNEKACEAR